MCMFLCYFFQIFQEIGLCDKIAEALVVNRIQETGGTCEICEFAIQELDSMLEDKQNEEQIKEAMEAVCSYLPDSIASECKTFMDTYVDTIIDMITNDATPKEVSIFKFKSSILVFTPRKTTILMSHIILIYSMFSNI